MSDYRYRTTLSGLKSICSSSVRTICQPEKRPILLDFGSASMGIIYNNILVLGLNNADPSFFRTTSKEEEEEDDKYHIIQSKKCIGKQPISVGRKLCSYFNTKPLHSTPFYEARCIIHYGRRHRPDGS